LTGLKGVSNEEVFSGARTVDIEGMKVSIISLEHLLLAKRSSDRPRDLADADELSKINASD
jgi:predicted nucleotidyltransferase